MTERLAYNQFHQIVPLAPAAKSAGRQAKPDADKQTITPGFAQILNQEISGVKFSQHALQRLTSRKIHLDSNQLGQLNLAIDKAAQKGSKEALVLLNDSLAFVVSVKNKTVVTAIDGASIKDNVFTNIDSAVII